MVELHETRYEAQESSSILDTVRQRLAFESMELVAYRDRRNTTSQITYDHIGRASITACLKYNADNWCAYWTQRPLLDSNGRQVVDPSRAKPGYSHGIFDVTG